MNIQALIELLAAIVGILGGGIAVLNFLRGRGHKARTTECYTLYKDRLGTPMTAVQKAARSKPFGTTGRVQRFSGSDAYVAKKLPNEAQHNYVVGVSVYSSNKGTFPVWGAIGQWYERAYGTAGRLGFPTSVEQQIHDNPKTWEQYFEGGKITCVFGKDPKIEYTRQK